MRKRLKALAMACACEPQVAFLIAAVSLGACIPSIVSGDVTLNTGGYTSEVVAYPSGSSSSATKTSLNPAGIPDSGTTGLVTSSPSSAEISYDLSETDLANPDFSLATSANNTNSNVYDSIYFSVDQKTDYTITGSIMVLDGLTSGSDVLLGGGLVDMTTRKTLYADSIYVVPTSDVEVFSLDARLHPLTGTLTPGDVYLWAPEAYIFSNSNIPCTATGSFDLHLDIPAAGNPAPLPAAAWMGLGLMGGLGAYRLRRSKNARARAAPM